MSLLTTLIVKNSHIAAGTYFIFLKKTSSTKLKMLSIPSSGKGEKIGKVVIKINFSAFLQIDSSNFRLKLYQNQ